MTEEPNGTVTNDTVSFAGSVDRAGSIQVVCNGTEMAAQTVAEKETFAFTLQLQQGRNAIALLFTDGAGAVTRKAYNVVWMTRYDMVVDAAYTGTAGAEVDGIPTYKTVQAAVDAVPSNNTERKVIYIKSGDYEERLVVKSPYISLLGEDEEDVRIHCYPAEIYPGDSTYEAGGDMSKRCATYVQSTATGFSAENLTFANDYDYGTPDNKSNKSADALRCDADQAVFVNVTFSGVQDTLYMHAGHQYYYQCRIEGLIDFIYSGDAARALFEDCEIVFVYESTRSSGGYVCAPRTAEDAEYGMLFHNCVITSETDCPDGTFCLARPWGANAYVCWIDCYMGAGIKKDEPYADMSGNSYMEARFFECGTYGPGYAINASRRQISPAKAQSMLANLGWNQTEAAAKVSQSYIGEHIHTYGEPTFTWSEDYATCTATFTCAVCATTEIKTCMVTSETTDPTCTEAGKVTYTATAEFGGTTYTDTKEVPGDPPTNPEEPTQPSNPETPPADKPDNSGTGDTGNGQNTGGQNNNPSSSGITAGKEVKDRKNQAVYKVVGNVTSGYTLTYVRPISKTAKTVKIPAAVTIDGVSYKVTAIANRAFKGMKKLKKVVIGPNVIQIGKKAFKGCKNLKKIVVRTSNLKKIGAGAFDKIHPKAKIIVPKKMLKKYKKLFTKKTGAKKSMLKGKA